MDQNYYTVLGWIVTIAGGGAAYYYYTNNNGRQREFRGRSIRNNLSRAAEVAAPVTEPIQRKINKSRPKPTNRASDSETRDSAAQASKPAYEEREEKEDMSWAHALAEKKQGTTLAPPARASTRQKTVKQTNANNRAAALSAESSSVDADDDFSPAVSPALNGEDPSGRDVSDMLEPAAAGPAVLKINEATNPKKQKPKQQPKKVEQETKKQRQNRQKVEEKKAARAAEEAARKQLEEKQRRAAREARGEPAKNGLGIASAPASNAWKATNSTTPAPATNGQLLDTFNNDDTTATESTAPTSLSTSPVHPATTDKWWREPMPSEQEQARMLLEQDENSWTTVPSKGKKGNKQVNGGAVQPVEAS